MAEVHFRFLHRYASSLGREGQRVQRFTAGEVALLPEETGAWIERDSPGALEQLHPDQVPAAMADHQAQLDRLADLHR